ncbi:hypothetical protein FISHEDRAFT_55199 [Fistulina hepatica ATCC 64428]|uniref:Cleavage stimulation factor subunit 2 hinge domain-containing protein n=1 Tax=Fistulina hepatica ATCC 64428 TaxID=1128425 RepID=A0A0D7ANM7_9AGAR|nr:hypothetical protein FISHEDRAFT_55199 [Fistulina hepatica ATCC 64428]
MYLLLDELVNWNALWVVIGPSWVPLTSKQDADASASYVPGMEINGDFRVTSDLNRCGRLCLRNDMSDESTVEQLLEFLLQLKKTTPDAARQILTAQPQIACALITLMVSMRAIDIDVFKATLANYGSKISQPPPSHTPTPVPGPSGNVSGFTPPTSVQVPPSGYVQPNHGLGYQGQGGAGRPPTGYGQPGPYNNHLTTPAYASTTSYAQASSPAYNSHPPGNDQTRGNGASAAPSANLTAIASAIAAMPEDQKVIIHTMVIRLLSMTPDQIAALPPTERASVMQLVRLDPIHSDFPNGRAANLVRITYELSYSRGSFSFLQSVSRASTVLSGSSSFPRSFTGNVELDKNRAIDLLLGEIGRALISSPGF